MAKDIAICIALIVAAISFLLLGCVFLVLHEVSGMAYTGTRKACLHLDQSAKVRLAKYKEKSS